MKTLKEYLFEGFFDTDTDAMPIYDSVKKWLDANTTTRLLKDADIDIKDDKIIFDAKRNQYFNFIYFKKKPEDFINFDKDNWLDNCIYANISKKYPLNKGDIDKYPFIGNTKIKATNFEISIFPSSITDVYIEGINQKLKNIVINCYTPENFNMNYKGFSITLDNFKLDDVDCIKVNCEEKCDILIKDTQLESYLEDLFYELNKCQDFAIHDCEKDLLTKYKQFFNWMDDNNIKGFEICNTFLQNSKIKTSNIKIYNHGKNNKRYNKRIN